jgi:hypothetical protein
MNALEAFLKTRGLEETKAMNALQDNGIISDECIFASHVHDSDCQRAIEWLVSPIQKKAPRHKLQSATHDKTTSSSGIFDRH